MKKLYQTTRRLLLTLLIVCSASLAWAQTLSGEGTKASPYLIQNADDWATFASNVNAGTSYEGQYLMLTDDISVSDMVGTSDHCFSGIFMGNGHTLTFNLETNELYVAPFRYVTGATISSLKTAGTIITSERFASGLVSYAKYGKTTIVNCCSSMTINCSYNSESRCGGFVAITNKDVTILNCRFDGQILAPAAYSNGGFVGNLNYILQDGLLYIYNSLFAPTGLSQGYSEYYPNNTFVNGSYTALRDCYYTQAFGNAQGTPVGEMTNDELQAALGRGWQVVDNKVMPIMDAKNLATGSIICESYFPYTGDNITVTPTVKDMVGDVVDPQNYSIAFSNPVLNSGEYTMTVTGNANGYTGSIIHRFNVAEQLSGEGTENSPYTISSVNDWNQFVNLVSLGCTYQDKIVKLATTNPITITQMVGVFDEIDNRPFCGTFDGDDKTLNVNITSTATGSVMNENGVAPFHHIKGATIKNLTVTGTITSNSQFAGGLVGLVSPGPYPDLYRSYITNCAVTATLNVTGNYPGGIIGHSRPLANTNQSIYLNDCVFAGTINNTSGNTNFTVGGMYGYGKTYVNLTNCLENGTYSGFHEVNPRNGMNDYSNQHTSSLYYVNVSNVTITDFLSDGFGCYKVEKTVPSDVVYLPRTFKGNNVVYQKAKLSGLRPYYAHTGEAIPLGYTLRMGAVTMTENTDYTVTIINDSNSQTVAPEELNQKGSYTIHFTASSSNTTGYAGELICSFQILEGESLDGGYVFATEGEDENKVYLINDEADLERLAEYVNSDKTIYSAPDHNALGMTFKLTSDIDLVGEHSAIGSGNDHKFCGTFNGNNKTISNLTINKPDDGCQGLFGYVGYSAVIKDLTLTNCSITAKNYVGGIVGYAYGNENSPVTIDSCHVNGTISSTVSDAQYHGGIVGLCYYTTISNCTMRGSVSTEESNLHYGGIGGQIGYSSSVINCENAASVIGPGNRHGGIAGIWYYNNTSANNCFNSGIVEGSNYVGNIVGYISSGHDQLSECYYASPTNVKAIGGDNNSSDLASQNVVRVYSINKGSHITSFNTSTATYQSVLDHKDYYKAGDWTLTFELESGYNFINYVCEGGTMTNLNTADGDHVLTINDQDVKINAHMSSTSATDISGATVSIPGQRWLGNVTLKPAFTVTYNNTPLEEDVDFFVEWGANNSTTDGGQVTLTGINNYQGTKEAEFDILDFDLKTPGSANSKDNPYLIQTAEDLEALASIVNTGARKNGFYRQTVDLILTKEHTPIGTIDNMACIDYDGNNKRIYGLNINQNTPYQGLFGVTRWDGGTTPWEPTIYDVNIVNCNIRGTHYVGGIVGYPYTSTNIDNCTVTGYVGPSEGIDNNSSGFGGIVGYERGGANISNCFSAAVVEGPKYVGSIIGYNNANSGSLTNNYHPVGNTGGVGSYNSTTGTDQEGAEIAVQISGGPNIEITYPAQPNYNWDSHDLYKSGVSVELSYTIPSGKYFERYSVSNGTISNPGIETGSHVLSGFTDNVVINGSYVDQRIDLSTATVVFSNIESFTYDANYHYPVPVITANDVTLEEGLHYTISYSDGITTNTTGFVNAGTYTVIATGIGSYEGSASASFTISPFDISTDNAVQVSGIFSEYGKSNTGDPVTPVPTVKCSSINNMTLTVNTDYTLSYSGECILPGDYNVILTGTNNFTGVKYVPFTILDMYCLTVHDGNSTSSNVPVYGTYCDYYVKTEFVMSKTDLANLTGKVINKMSFYLSYKANAVWNGTFKVFLKEYESDNLYSTNGFSGIEDATIVYEGSLDGTHDVMTVNFSSPFYYSGNNNLLIGFYKTTKDNSPSASFYGDYIYNKSIGGTDSNSLETVSANSRYYLPKTTFWYGTSPDHLLSVTGYGTSTESDHWMFIASPVTEDLAPTSIANLVSTVNYDLYRLNPNTTRWENYKNASHTDDFVLENGKGYLYANKYNFKLAFMGTLNTADSKEMSLSQGWNLVGNPFPVAAYVDRPFYKLNDDGSVIVPVENYDEYEPTTIPACTGIVVQAEEEGETVTFSKVEPDAATGNHGNLNIVLTQANTRGNDMLDKAIISFNESKLGKFYFGEQNANVYIPQDGKEYAIVSAEAQGEMPVNFKANKNGEYTLTISSPFTSHLSPFTYLHLIDNMTGNDIDLLVEPSYTFKANTGDYESRFKLVFSANENDNENENFAFINNGDIIVNGEGTLEIIDALGRIILTREVAPHTSLSTPNSSLAPGVYVLRLINGENVKTQKIIVK